MSLIIKILDKKTIIKNIVKILNISKISNWSFENFTMDLPGKWKRSIAVFDKIKKEIVAFCIISEKKNSLHIHLLMVSNKYQGMGVGTNILKIIDKYDKKITVKTYTPLRKTIRFYLKNDFKIKVIKKKTILMQKN